MPRATPYLLGLTVVIVATVAGVAYWSFHKTALTYDDCMLEHLKGEKSPLQLQLIAQSCRERYPVRFDLNLIAKQAGTKTWVEVQGGSEYQALSDADKLAVKKQYWSQILEPWIREDFRTEEERKFLSSR